MTLKNSYLLFLAFLLMSYSCKSPVSSFNKDMLFSYDTLYQMKTYRDLNAALQEPESVIKLIYFNMNTNKAPKEILQFENLNVLEITHNKLSNLPSQFSQLQYLQSIYLQHNNFTTIPEVVFQYEHLKRFGIDNNHIEIIPENISKLKQLQELYLGNNQIANVPEYLSDCSELKVLNINGNRLTTLPKSLSSLKNLQRIFIAKNEFTEIPDVLFSMPQLKLIDLSQNNIPKAKLVKFKLDHPNIKIVI